MPPRFLFVLICVLTLAFAVLSGLAKVLGAQQPINPALGGFVEGCEDKPQPCWYGIMPGNTSGYEANRILIERRYQLWTFLTEPDVIAFIAPDSTTMCDVQLSQEGNLVRLIRLNDCNDLHLGELVNLLGTPEEVFLNAGGGPLISYYLNHVWGQVNDWSSPYDRLWSISLWIPETNSTSYGYPWHGFVRHWRYCQLEPRAYSCS